MPQDETKAALRAKGIIMVKGIIDEEMAYELEKDLLWFSSHGAPQIERLRIHIDSPGGEAYFAIKMYRRLRHTKIPTTGIVTNEASSMATIVLQGCSFRAMYLHAKSSVVHRLEKCTKIPGGELLAQKTLESQQREVDQIYMEHTDRGPQALAWIYDKWSPLSAPQMLAVGLVDHVFSDIEEPTS